ncbi:L-glutamine:scyllo-inosose aminotransferase [Aquisphaera giovannonii]|uniref:L-glutamine:scyllo-inosose aminotransferase n=1 Tax=Aquisphaera giovannonii TaxID=406548 RepID=A0A5B9VX98_9BACT|nr:DegT/DnrJ/EryC1/StrS family aminotransferase [Aquisphaera giovannonii]QEH32405.1 L-glutamine:scyllo-inosose aminotransferase [Aquisphaera giovannonii]
MTSSKLAIHGGPKAVSAKPVPVSPLDPSELKAALGELIDAGEFSDASGAGAIGRFERSFAEYIGCDHGLGFCNGTSALLAAYLACGVGPGDEVIHPCYSWVASVAPLLLLGARPVFCGVSPLSLLIDPAAIGPLITPRTRAISVVHMHGAVCEMDAVLEIARARGLPVIEDGSHCHGASYRGRRCGSLGDVGCFSMQGGPVGGKPVACGEGGIAVCRSRDLYERMTSFAQINRVPGGGFLDAELAQLAPFNSGMKFRAHPWAMACASLMLRDLDRANAEKREVRARVQESIEPLWALTMCETAADSTPGGFYGGINLLHHPERAGGVPAARILDALKAEGVACGPAPYPLLHRLPLFRGDAPGARRLYPWLAETPAPAASTDLGPSEDAHGRVVNVLFPMQLSPGDPYVPQMLDAFRKVYGHLSRGEFI